MVTYRTVKQRVTLGAQGISLELSVVVDFTKAVEAIEAELRAAGQMERAKDMVPYFGTIWDAARGLGNVFADMSQDWFAGRTFVEIGCGLAIPSIVAAKKGAGRVIATDQHPDVPRFLDENMKANGVEVEYRSIDWRGEVKDICSGGRTVIVGSDILYDLAKAKGVAGFLRAAFDCGAEEAVIADSGRPNRKDFLAACEANGLQVSTDVHELVVSGQKRDVFVMWVKCD